MGKGLQIILLALVFGTCGVGGWFLEELVLEGSSAQEAVVAEEITEPEPEPYTEPEPVAPTVSAVPLISKVSVPQRNAETGKYSFSVEASVESGDRLVYALYSDEACTKEVASAYDGRFSNIPSTSSAVYYLQVRNDRTADMADVVSVNGFVKVATYVKITKEELAEYLTANAPGYSKDMEHRTAKNLKIICKGITEGESLPQNIYGVQEKLILEMWKPVEIESISHDEQGKMSKVELIVTYP